MSSAVDPILAKYNLTPADPLVSKYGLTPYDPKTYAPPAGQPPTINPQYVSNPVQDVGRGFAESLPLAGGLVGAGAGASVGGVGAVPGGLVGAGSGAAARQSLQHYFPEVFGHESVSSPTERLTQGALDTVIGEGSAPAKAIGGLIKGVKSVPQVARILKQTGDNSSQLVKDFIANKVGPLMEGDPTADILRGAEGAQTTSKIATGPKMPPDVKIIHVETKTGPQVLALRPGADNSVNAEPYVTDFLQPDAGPLVPGKLPPGANKVGKYTPGTSDTSDKVIKYKNPNSVFNEGTSPYNYELVPGTSGTPGGASPVRVPTPYEETLSPAGEAIQKAGFDPENVVAKADYHRNPNGSLEINNIMTHPDHGRQGIMSGIEDYANQNIGPVNSTGVKTDAGTAYRAAQNYRSDMKDALNSKTADYLKKLGGDERPSSEDIDKFGQHLLAGPENVKNAILASGQPKIAESTYLDHILGKDSDSFDPKAAIERYKDVKDGADVAISPETQKNLLTTLDTVKNLGPDPKQSAISYIGKRIAVGVAGEAIGHATGLGFYPGEAAAYGTFYLGKRALKTMANSPVAVDAFKALSQTQPTSPEAPFLKNLLLRSLQGAQVYHDQGQGKTEKATIDQNGQLTQPDQQ